MDIKSHIYDQLVEITKRAKPNEAAALLFNDNSIVEEAHPFSKSVAHFSDVDPVWMAELIGKYGSPSALFHSHPCAAVPSYTDLEYMLPSITFYGCVWLIMSDTMKLRAWTIKGGPKRGQTVYPKEVELVII